MIKMRFYSTILFSIATIMAVTAQNNIIEEVAWVVGDEPIYKSEIEEQYMQMQYERQSMEGNPYCVIPEQIAINKLFLHQAKLDTVEVQDAMVMQQADSRINYFIANLGSKEKVEEYFRKPLPELREQMMDVIRDQYSIQEVQRNLTSDIKATPSDVRKYFSSLSTDSIPFVPLQVEVQIITLSDTLGRNKMWRVLMRSPRFSINCII